MPAQTSRRGVLLAAVIGCLLVFAGLVSTGDSLGSHHITAPAPAVAGDPFAAPRGAGSPATYGPRMPGRAATVTGHRLAPLGASGIGQLAERVASLADRTSPGPGDHLAVGPAGGDLWGSASRPTRLERVAVTEARAPRAASAAPAPPAA